MTQAQTSVLKWFAQTNTGAVAFDGHWIFPQHVRDDAELARKMADAGMEARFDTILKDWKADMMADIETRVRAAETGEDWAEICRLEALAMKPPLLPAPAEMTVTQLLDEFCFFAAERAEAKGRNSTYNDKHLIRLFGELKRRNLFPE